MAVPRSYFTRISRVWKGCLIFLCLFLVTAPMGVLAQEEKKTEKPLELIVVDTPMEKEHRPLVVVPENIYRGEIFTVSVQVGDKPHPVTKAHHIEWIEISLNDSRLLHMTLTETIGEVRFTFPLKLKDSAVLKVEAHCNQHGTWGREMTVGVRPASTGIAQ